MLSLITLSAVVLSLLLASCTAPGGSETPRVSTSGEHAAFPNLFSGTGAHGSAAYTDEGTPTVEVVLETGLLTAGASPVHLAFRGTAAADTIRCQWRGVARTAAQREAAIRFWLELPEDDSLPSPIETERRLLAALDQTNAAFAATLRANLRSLAEGGVSTDYQFLTCYTDYTVSDFFLGTGQENNSTLTVAYDRLGEERSYEVYESAHAAGEFGDQSLLTEDEYLTHLDELATATELTLKFIIGERDAVLFLAPMAAHNAIAVEVWQTIAQWDVQTDDNGTLQAIRYGSGTSDPEHTQTLASLKSRITTAATTDAFAGQRIANVSSLSQYYRDIGAYDDITPGDGSDETFMPDMPPPTPTCAGSTAVGSNPSEGLIDDCNALLAAKDTLAGTANLNWSKDLAMTDWDGIRLDESPRRVHNLLLTSKNLDGSIPAILGNLTELQRIDLDQNTLSGAIPPQLGSLKRLKLLHLQNNQLSGEIPPELAAIRGLRVLYLSANQMTGPIPHQIGNLRQLQQLILADNQLSGPIPQQIGSLTRLRHLRLEDAGLSGQIPRSLSAIPIEYLGLSGNAFTGCLPTGLDSATGHDLDSAELSTLPTCGPTFTQETYSFTVARDAATGTTVGTVSAQPYEQGDQLTFTITSGNNAALFTMNASTGVITLSRAPTPDDEALLTITVESQDSHGQTATAQVAVTLSN